MIYGKIFVLLCAFIFFWTGYSTFRHNMLAPFFMMTLVMWLGIAVGFCIKVWLEMFK